MGGNRGCFSGGWLKIRSLYLSLGASTVRKMIYLSCHHWRDTSHHQITCDSLSIEILFLAMFSNCFNCCVIYLLYLINPTSRTDKTQQVQFIYQNDSIASSSLVNESILLIMYNEVVEKIGKKNNNWGSDFPPSRFQYS